MVARLLACWAVLALLLGFTAPPRDPLGLEPVIEMFRLPGVQVSVSWMPCGQANAFYSQRGGMVWSPTGVIFIEPKSVVLCTELQSLVRPAAIRFILAHELAHAVIMQRDIPYTGSGETAADELAAVMLSVYDHRGDVIAMAEFFERMGGEDNAWDDHPAGERRGVALRCLAYGSMNAAPYGCPVSWERVHRAWVQLLGV